MSPGTPNESEDAPGDSFAAGLLTVAFPLLPLVLFLSLGRLIEPISQGTVFRVAWPWMPSLDVELSFYADGLSLLFAVLITSVGVMVFVYAPAYLGGDVRRWRLYSWLILFMTSMLGVVLADNIITLFVFWELTSITSYMLIGFRHEEEKARAAALQALLVTGFGGLVLLAGLLLLGHSGGSYSLSELLQRGDVLRNHPLLTPTIVLILIGAFTKSAQFPFHFWLPNAMEAPAPVSAYLHSATMVKAGVYLVARLSPVFAGIAIWEDSLVVVGTVTALVGGYLSLQEVDLKRILAYSTVSALGTLMLLSGLGTPLATKAAVVFLVSHAMYKSALFLVAGTIDHCTGHRDIRSLAGLIRVMPLVVGAGGLAAFSMAGFPPTSGFLAKEVIYETLLDSPPAFGVLLLAVFLINVSFVTVSCLVAVRPSFGHPTAAVREAHPAAWRLVLPAMVLSVMGLMTGLFPGRLTQYLVGPAVVAVAPHTGPVTLKLWHGFNLPLLMSAATLLAGGFIYVRRSSVRAFGQRVSGLVPWGPAAAYDFSLTGLKAVAAWQTSVLQNGRLRTYLLVVLSTFSGVVAYELASHVKVPAGPPWLDVQLHEYCLPALILAATVMAVRSRSRLIAVCALGVIGYAIAMLFVMFGAPDLAMTQFAIETLTVVVFVSVIYRFPHFSILSSRAAKARDAVVALIAGGVMTGVVLTTTAAHAPSRLSQFFVDNSLSQAKGENMVNVILVDFRGLDTLGEIMVLAVAALGVYTLMRLTMEPNASATECSDVMTTSNESSAESDGADSAEGGVG